MRQQLAIVGAVANENWGDHPIFQKLTIVEAWNIFVDMNPKKPKTRKSKSAGISLEPDLIKRGKEFAEKNGFGSLSNYTRFLLTQELSRAAGEACYTLQETKGDEPQDTAGNFIITPATSGGGHSTQSTTRYQKAGRRKSSNSI